MKMEVDELREGQKMIDLAILPTAGIVWSTEENCWIPTPSGKMRCDKLISMWKNGEIRAIAIIGGRRIGSQSEALTYAEYMRIHCPGIYIAIVDAQATCTNRDLVAANDRIASFLQTRYSQSPQESVIGIVSYQEHLERIEIVLRHLGFKNFVRILSGETANYTLPFLPPKTGNFLVEWSLTTVTRIDPEWRLIGWPLVWAADRRLRENHRE
jgi:hypothetical protein